MTDEKIIDEVIRYISDESYNYALLIDGEWGCGKTYFIQDKCIKAIETYEKERKKEPGKQRKIKYISLYGCKSIKEIQENIAWGFLDNINEKMPQKIKDAKYFSSIGKNILASSKKIGREVLKLIPTSEESTYEIASDWLLMKANIFIFDDIERCDCPLNEMFGFFNGLVEHEETKIILVANEKEIAVKSVAAQKALQYMLALDDNIKWPVEKSPFGRSWTQTTNQEKVDLQELERRRTLLFPDNVEDEYYKKIREKLIGITLYYQPDINEALKNIIDNSSLPDKLKKDLSRNLSSFNGIMEHYYHHNLRTFQFFLSKISRLNEEMNEMEPEIETDYISSVRDFVILDCFQWAVEFKGNIPMPINEHEKILYELRKKSHTIKKYVEEGDFCKEDFKVDILAYTEEELRNKLADDDPLSLLEREYWVHRQEWAVDKIEEIQEKIQKDKYKLYFYTRIIILLLKLCDMGFDYHYIQETKNMMLKSIYRQEGTIRLDTDIFFIENPHLKERIICELEELNHAIENHSDEVQRNIIEEAFSNENWIEELKNYTGTECGRHYKDIAIFSQIDAEKWIEKIIASEPKELDAFRKWLYLFYPRDVVKKSITEDIPVLIKIEKGIDSNKSEDKIIKMNLELLKEQIQEIVTRTF